MEGVELPCRNWRIWIWVKVAGDIFRVTYPTIKLLGYIRILIHCLNQVGLGPIMKPIMGAKILKNTTHLRLNFSKTVWVCIAGNVVVSTRHHITFFWHGSRMCWTFWMKME